MNIFLMIEPYSRKPHISIISFCYCKYISLCAMYQETQHTLICY